MSRQVERVPWLSGVVTPVCTPLTDELEVDAGSLERLVAFHLEAGVEGIFVLGSSGEVAFLRDDQRDLVVEVVTKTVAGQVPVLAGAIDMTTPRSVDQAERAIRKGADAIVVTAPFYARVTHPGEIEQHFRTIKAATGVRVIAYDIPAAVHTKLDPTLLTELAYAGIIDGVKDSSGDLHALRQLVMGASSISELSIFTGSEVVVDAALLIGVDGAVPGLANVDPHAYVRLHTTARASDWTGARTQQERLVRLFALTACADPARRGQSSSVIGAFKTALMLRGVIATNAVALPQARLEEDEVARVMTVLDEAGLVP